MKKLIPNFRKQAYELDFKNPDFILDYIILNCGHWLKQLNISLNKESVKKYLLTSHFHLYRGDNEIETYCALVDTRKNKKIETKDTLIYDIDSLHILNNAISKKYKTNLFNSLFVSQMFDYAVTFGNVYIVIPTGKDFSYLYSKKILDFGKYFHRENPIHLDDLIFPELFSVKLSILEKIFKSENKKKLREKLPNFIEFVELSYNYNIIYVEEWFRFLKNEMQISDPMKLYDDVNYKQIDKIYDFKDTGLVDHILRKDPLSEILLSGKLLFLDYFYINEKMND